MIKQSVKKPFTIFVAMAVIIILGLVSYIRMVPDLFPEMDLPYVVVLTPYPGSTPEKVESEINKPLERSFMMLENIENVQSTANSSYSVVTLEFNEEADINDVVVDILQDINMHEGSWDEMIGTSTIMKLNPSMIPVSVMAVEYEGYEISELSNFLEEELLDELEGVTGVASVDANGILKERIMVSINQAKIDNLNNKILDELDTTLANSKNELISQKNALNEGLVKTKDGLEEIDSGLDQVNQGLIGIQVSKSLIDGLENVEDSDELDDFIEENEVELPIDENTLTQYTTFKENLDSQEKELLETKETLENSKSELLSTQDTMIEAQGQLSEALISIDEQAKEARNQADISDKITIDTVVNLLKAQNFDMPAGYVGETDDRLLISVGDKVTSLDALNNLLLMNVELGDIEDIRLKDVADVSFEDNSNSIYANLNGNSSVMLMLSKQSNYATALVSGNINNKINELENRYEGLNLVPLMDQGEYINVMIASILKSLIFGALFAIIILFIFLKDFKPTIITIASIPISLLFAIFLMYMFGVSINLISISGLAVAVGMIVDNSVVVIENIYRLRMDGFSVIKACYAGAKQVAGAITASTLTTVSVFIPIIFIQGLTKQLFSDMAITVAVSLIASLIVGLTLVPAMSSKLLVNTIPKEPKINKLATKYKETLSWALHHKVSVLTGVILLLVITGSTLISKGFIFMPEMNSPQVNVEVDFAEDTTYEVMSKNADEIVGEISQIEGVSDVGTMMGNNMSGMEMDATDYTNITMYVLLDIDSNVKSNDVEKAIGEIKVPKGTSISAEGSDASDFTAAMGGEGVSIDVKGTDLYELQEAALSISEKLETVEGIETVNNGLDDSEPELHFVVNKNEAMKDNLMIASIYGAISEKLNNEKSATDIYIDDKNYEVVVSAKENKNITREELENLTINDTSMTGEDISVNLADITETIERNTLSEINRKNQNRIITVGGTLEEGYNITLTTSNAEKAIGELELPEGITVEFHGENETVMDGMNKLTIMLLLGVVFIYLIMVAQFQSLKSPFIIMFTIPLAMTGGFLALLVTNSYLSVVAMIGMVMLVGIIVNNGIVLVDYTNQLRARGRKKKDALTEAGITRMRPILMTSLTTVCGLIVMALGREMGTEMMQPLAIVCIGGLIYATLMTLYIVPCIYDLLHGEEYKIVREEELDVSDIIV